MSNKFKVSIRNKLQDHGFFVSRYRHDHEVLANSDIDLFCERKNLSKAMDLISALGKITHIVRRSYVTSIFVTSVQSGELAQVDLEHSFDWWGLKICDCRNFHKKTVITPQFLIDLEIVRSYLWSGKIKSKFYEKKDEDQLRKSFARFKLNYDVPVKKVRRKLLENNLKLYPFKTVLNVLYFILFELSLFFQKNGKAIKISNQVEIKKLKSNLCSACYSIKNISFHDNIWTYRAQRDISNSYLVFTNSDVSLSLDYDKNTKNYILMKHGELVSMTPNILGFLHDYK